RHGGRARGRAGRRARRWGSSRRPWSTLASAASGIAGGAVLALFLVFQFVNPRQPVVANTPGFRDPVAGFELASSPADVLGILGPPGNPARADAVRGMRGGLSLDFLFLLAYPTFYVGIVVLPAARDALGRSVAAAVI